jgi:hypothetical protein
MQGNLHVQFVKRFFIERWVAYFPRRVFSEKPFLAPRNPKFFFLKVLGLYIFLKEAANVFLYGKKLAASFKKNFFECKVFAEHPAIFFTPPSPSPLRGNSPSILVIYPFPLHPSLPAAQSSMRQTTRRKIGRSEDRKIGRFCSAGSLSHGRLCSRKAWMQGERMQGLDDFSFNAQGFPSLKVRGSLVH